MNRKLFTQIWNEKSANVSLFIELLLVSVVLWFVVDFLYVHYNIYTQPRGFDITHCYNVKIGKLPELHPDYLVGADDAADLLGLLDQVRLRPDVEAVSLSAVAYPYHGGNHWNNWFCKDTTARTNFLIRYVTPDFIRVFQYHGERGESPDRLAEIMRTMPPQAILGGSVNKRKFKRKVTSDYVGIDFYRESDTLSAHPFVAAIAPVRYSDFSIDIPFLLVPLKEEGFGEIDMLDCCLRVKPEQDVDFIDRFMKDASRYYRKGNIYLSNTVSFDYLRANYQLDDNQEVRNYLIGTGFLLFNIFLGLLGIFWFRTQRRRSEIAIHKAFGSTRRQVFGRLILEGLILLTLATLPALLIDYNIAHFELTQWYDDEYITLSRFIVTTSITWGLMALMIIGGIWFPARKAMRIEPAIALREE